MKRWRSGLPSGSPRTGGRDDSSTILDCVFDEASATFYAIDVLCWGGYSLYDCDVDFRFYWLRSKLDEVGDFGDYEVAIPPFYAADAAGVREAYAAPLPFLRDGLLLYDRRGHYALGLTPLVALYKDAACTRFFAPADESIFAVLAVGEASALTTLDGAAVPRADAAPLAPHTLVRCAIAVLPDGTVAASYDRPCSSKRALADSASKIAFAVRHRTAPLAIEALLAAPPPVP